MLERWPHVPRARDALLRLAEAYQAIRYRDDLAETCTKLRQTYPGDPEIGRTCGTVRTADTTMTRPPPRPPTPRGD